MFKQFTMELAGRTLRVDIGRVCAQANGAALMHYGDTVVLSTATASKEPREGIDFFPLSVEYEEKMSKLERKVDGLELKDEIKSRAIAQHLRCSYPPTDKKCPVAVFINRSEDIIKRKTKELKDKREANEQ